MFRSYDHHQAEKYITTLGLFNDNGSVVTLRRRIKTHIIWYHTRNRMQTPQIKFVKAMLRFRLGGGSLYRSQAVVADLQLKYEAFHIK
jgi:CobQ-like glutamine amidotransferase family enzyme